MAVASSDWAWLPRDLLFSIVDCIIEFADIVRFGCVCKPWCSVIAEKTYDDNKLLPMLIIPTKDDNKEKRSLYSITECVTYDITLPQPYDLRFFGSSHGWLFTIGKYSMVITLVNPFSGSTIRLPMFKDPDVLSNYFLVRDRPEYYIYKGILSSDPCLNPNNYQVVLVYGNNRRLAVLKSGEETWRFIKITTDFGLVSDVIYFKGQLHAVSPWGEVVVFDVSGDGSSHRAIIKKNPGNADQVYIVESRGGDLLLVERTYNAMEERFHWKTLEFRVSKLVHAATNSTSKEAEWVLLDSLDDEALFVGANYSVSRSVSSMENHSLPIGFRHNCIYYTDQCWYDNGIYTHRGVDDDNGIFCVAEWRFVGKHFVPDPSHKHLLPAIWILPNSNATVVENNAMIS